jgi:hypothetical protein
VYSRINIKINFFLQVQFQQSDIVPIICHRYPQHQRYRWQNLLPVSLTPVVHLHLRISPQIFEKIWNYPIIIFEVLEEDDSWKKPEAKKISFSFIDCKAFSFSR